MAADQILGEEGQGQDPWRSRSGQNHLLQEQSPSFFGVCSSLPKTSVKYPDPVQKNEKPKNGAPPKNFSLSTHQMSKSSGWVDGGRSSLSTYVC